MTGSLTVDLALPIGPEFFYENYLPRHLVEAMLIYALGDRHINLSPSYRSWNHLEYWLQFLCSEISECCCPHKSPGVCLQILKWPCILGPNLWPEKHIWGRGLWIHKKNKRMPKRGGANEQYSSLVEWREDNCFWQLSLVGQPSRYACSQLTLLKLSRGLW